MNFQEHFTKGWTDQSRWNEYVDARNAAAIMADNEGDDSAYFSMDCIIRAEGADRKPVDSRIFSTNCQDLDIWTNHKQEPFVFGSKERDMEFKHLQELAELRDIPLADLDDCLAHGLRTNSYFAKHIEVNPYVAGVDYIKTEKIYAHIQSGMKPLEKQQIDFNILRQPLTGRDWATYVHTDNPMILWMKIAGELLSLGVPYRTEFGDSRTREDAAFASWGMPFFMGLIGETIKRVGLINFRTKHVTMGCRPEEYAMKRFGEILPQCFIEGSPMHGSFTAMHAAISKILALLFAMIFDGHHPLGDSTVGAELYLIGENVADGRLWAGVHAPEDNASVDGIVTALADRIFNQYMGIELRQEVAQSEPEQV